MLRLMSLMLGALALWLPATEPAPPTMALTFTPAVIEAFVSEGCQHSPAVMEFLNHVVDRARTEDAPVYVLSYHVAYWNHLGWPDRFADEAHDVRQEEYAGILRQPALRTPLVVLNGATVISRAGLPHIMHLLNNTLGVPPVAGIAVTGLDHDDDTVVCTLVMRGRLDDLRTQVALVERELVSEVDAGENRGQRLVHHSTVRDLATAAVVAASTDEDDAARHMSLTLRVPEGADPARLQVVAFLQDPTTLRILAAHGRDLVAPPAP